VRVLVTGAAGFLGAACVRALRAAGHAVIETDRRGTALPGDLSMAEFCARLPEVDAVVHCAAVQYVTPQLPLLRRAAIFRRDNVEATRQLCARYSGRVAHFVNIGTSMLYRQCHQSLYGPESPMAAQGVYSASKLAALAHVRTMANPNASVIPCIIGGPGRAGLFGNFVRMMRRSRKVLVPGAGRHPIQMVAVDDVAALVRLVLAQRAVGLINAGAPLPLGIHQWIDEIEAELALPPVRRVAVPLAPLRALGWFSGYRLLAREQLLMLGQPHVLDTAAAQRLGWRPRHSNAAVVRSIARHLARAVLR